MLRTFTTHSRLINELFANYLNTFFAFCELINNSLQANAKNIWIDVDYTSNDEALQPLVIKKMVIRDDGDGVYVDDINEKLLNIGTNNKEGGKGIGRFAAFQLGQTIEIETVGKSQAKNKSSKTIIPLNYKSFGKNINVSEVPVTTKEEIFDGILKTYYQVTIMDFYDDSITDSSPKKKIVDKLLKENLAAALFERYSLKIYNRDVKFYVNNHLIDPTDYIIGSPSIEDVSYIDKAGKNHVISFRYINLKHVENRKVFLTTTNAGIQTIASGFEFDAEWLSPKIGGWFIYINSDTLGSDLYRNISLDDMDENFKHYKAFLKNQLAHFFREKNKEFDNFLDKLKQDDYYPYKDKQSSSKSKIMLFDKLAFLVEDKYNLLNEKNKLREIIYPLIDRTISNRELDNVLKSVLKLNNKTLTQFNNLLNRTELEDVIEFADKVSIKQEELEFLEKLVYSEISKYVKERKELHKFLERMLWVFGEEFAGNTKLFSDKNLANNLTQLRNDLMQYKPSKKDDNINEKINKTEKSITDLFMYNERIIDSSRREVLIVELKAPKVKISSKELQQAMHYAQAIETSSSTPRNISFKVLLISSDISSNAAYQIKGEDNNPFVYFTSQSKRVEVWVMRWCDLIERQRQKLKYLSNALEIKDIDVREKAAKDFAEIEFQRTSATLKQVMV